ncbi:MAG: hypothetical protein LUF82_07300 [Clostridia bacterium]|nr:hypothetical protein [Clostridia bacterium]
MKSLKKVLLCVVAVAVSAAALSFAACSGDDALNGTYEGEYKYANPYATDSYYGVKVAVTVEDDVITSVETIDSDYIEVSDSNATYGWDNTVYTNSKATLLAAYKGKTVDDILALTVACEDGGEPSTQDAEGFVNYGSDLVLTGATQCSGRLLLAVQNALTEKSKIYVGEYKYANPYATGSYYGVRVAVKVENGTITSVSTISTDYIEVSDSNATYGWDNTVYTNSKSTLLAAYNGKSVSDILALTVACEDGGEPSTQDAEGFVNYGSDLVLTGATQCSGRLLLAVQDALKNV